MVQIILMILKFVGITAGILLAVILALALLLLFVPVRYDLSGEKKEELAAGGKVHWLFHIVTFQIVYEKEEVRQVLRIFGVPVWKK